MSELDDLHTLLRARPAAGAVNLAGYDPTDTSAGLSGRAVLSRKEAEAELVALRAELFDLHERLMAERRRSVLLILQGLDCSGNRSHYEDAIVPLACGTGPAEVVDERIEQINDVEAELHQAGTVVVTCFLHLSYDEQRRRFLRRLCRDDKRWKFSEGDLDTRRRWNEFQSAYGSVMARTTPDHAPWLVIPADAKWYRNWLVARLLRATLVGMQPDYPRVDLDIDRLELLLQPPN